MNKKFTLENIKEEEQIIATFSKRLNCLLKLISRKELKKEELSIVQELVFELSNNIEKGVYNIRYGLKDLL